MIKLLIGQQHICTADLCVCKCVSRLVFYHSSELFTDRHNSIYLQTVKQETGLRERVRAHVCVEQQVLKTISSYEFTQNASFKDWNPSFFVLFGSVNVLTVASIKPSLNVVSVSGLDLKKMLKRGRQTKEKRRKETLWQTFLKGCWMADTQVKYFCSHWWCSLQSLRNLPNRHKVPDNCVYNPWADRKEQHWVN